MVGGARAGVGWGVGTWSAPAELGLLSKEVEGVASGSDRLSLPVDAGDERRFSVAGGVVTEVTSERGVAGGGGLAARGCRAAPKARRPLSGARGASATRQSPCACGSSSPPPPRLSDWLLVRGGGRFLRDGRTPAVRSSGWTCGCCPGPRTWATTQSVCWRRARAPAVWERLLRWPCRLMPASPPCWRVTAGPRGRPRARVAIASVRLRSSVAGESGEPRGWVPWVGQGPPCWAWIPSSCSETAWRLPSRSNPPSPPPAMAGVASAGGGGP